MKQKRFLVKVGFLSLVKILTWIFYLNAFAGINDGLVAYHLISGNANYES